MSNRPSSIDILQKYWGYDDFRDQQAKVIDDAIQGKDALVIMPTGGGKSICYQIPALLMEGICIVVSPLIALMKDQVDQLNTRGIKADAIFSGLTKHEIDVTLDNAVYGETKFLYVSPERLETEIFRERVKKMKVNMIAVDEAHCISQWGYDFRPSYLNIISLRELLPDAPLMALTASAPIAVRSDIVERLEIKGNVFTSSFQRKNIAYVSRKVENKSAKLMEALESLGGSGIVYVRSRKKTVMVADHLNQHGVNASHYHAGLKSEERDKRQQDWMTGKTAVMVCTNAFGMGIDKSAVRFVIHWDIPDSLEAYYQEAGRAGRDGKMSYALLLYTPADLSRLKTNIAKHFPTLPEIRTVYSALCNYFKVALNNGYMMSFDFDLLQFAKTYKLEMMKTYHIINILEKEGYLLSSDGFKLPSRLKFTISKSDLYRFQVENEKWDKLIQVLLRTYGGIIDHYIPINEQYMADRLQTTAVQLTRDLQLLKKKGIFNYIPYRNAPTITLLKNRLSEKSLLIDVDFWKTRKKIAEEKVDAILAYCTSDDRCKQQIISTYFGESDAEACGKCDYCIAQKSAELSQGEYTEIKLKILDMLEKEHCIEIAELESDLGFYGKQNYHRVIRRLMDEGILNLDDKKRISLVNATKAHQ